MSYRALYRAWRPRRFGDVKGQEHITNVLKSQVKSGRVAHAYLFSGPRGTGKTSMAKVFARAVNCADAVDGEPCGQCPLCRSVDSDTAVDVVEIDAASNNGVENIRDLRERVNLLPAAGRYKVYIIDEAHMLSPGAFNALLKTLEEPPPHAVFILATTEPRKLPATILSRCQRYDFKRIAVQEIARRTMEVADAEHIKAEEHAVRMIARAAEGSLRDALSLLDQLAAMTGGATAANVEALLGGADRKSLFELARLVAGFDIQQALQVYTRMRDAGADTGVLLKDLTGLLRDMLTAGFWDAEYGFAFVYEDIEEIRDSARRMGKNALLRALETLLRCEQDLRYHSQPDIVFQAALIRAMTPEDCAGADADMAARLDRMQRQMDGLRETPAGPTAAQTPEAPKKQPAKEKALDAHATVVSASEEIRPEKKSRIHRGEWEKLLLALRKQAGHLYEAATRMTLLESAEEGFKLSCPKEYGASADLFSLESARAAVNRAAEQALGRGAAITITVEAGKKSDGFLIENLGPGVINAD